MLIVGFCHSNKMKIKVIIPCHLDSKRLDQKVLIDINGLPMVEHVRRRVLLSKKTENVFIATGDQRIKDVVESFGGDVLFTKKKHENGTSRISEAISNTDCTHVILIQGDEPLIIPEYIDIFIDQMLNSESYNMWNAISKLNSNEVYNDLSKVKCLIDVHGQFITCFRKTPISSPKNNLSKIIFKVQGLIAYKKKFLLKLVDSPSTIYSNEESIEQMKAIEAGEKIKSILLPSSLPSVNTKKELEHVFGILEKDSIQKKIFQQIIKS